jgi:hypothetical protein
MGDYHFYLLKHNIISYFLISVIVNVNCKYFLISVIVNSFLYHFEDLDKFYFILTLAYCCIALIYTVIFDKSGAFFFIWLKIFFLIFKIFYSYEHTIFGSFLPPTPHSLATRQKLFCPHLLFCWRENVRDNRKDQGVLLVVIRIAIQGVDLHCSPVHVFYLLNKFFSN